MKKITLEEFKTKYHTRTRITCGIHFEDGYMITAMNMNFNWCMYEINSYSKEHGEVTYIAIK